MSRVFHVLQRVNAPLAGDSPSKGGDERLCVLASRAAEATFACVAERPATDLKSTSLHERLGKCASGGFHDSAESMGGPDESPLNPEYRYGPK